MAAARLHLHQDDLYICVHQLAQTRRTLEEAVPESHNLDDSIREGASYLYSRLKGLEDPLLALGRDLPSTTVGLIPLAAGTERVLRRIQPQLHEIDMAVLGFVFKTIPADMRNSCCSLSKNAFDIPAQVPLEFKYNVPVAKCATVIGRNGPISELISLYDQAISRLQESGNIKTHTQLHLLCNLARLYCHQSRWEEGESLLIEFLNPTETDKTLTSETIETLTLLANILRMQGKQPEAETAYRRILSLALENPNTSDHNVLTTFLDLHQICELQGKTVEAREFGRRFIEALFPERNLASPAPLAPEEVPSEVAQTEGSEEYQSLSDLQTRSDPSGYPNSEDSSLMEERLNLWLKTDVAPWTIRHLGW